MLPAALNIINLSKFKALIFEDTTSKFAQMKRLVFYSIENIGGKRRKCWKPNLFSFSQNGFKSFPCQGRYISGLYDNGLISECLLIVLTLSQTSHGFYVSALLSLLKTLWEKEKLLVTSNFSFSHIVF